MTDELIAAIKELRAFYAKPGCRLDDAIHLVCAAAERAEAERDALREDAARLLRFAGACLDPWPECLCDLEGDMQDRLHTAGLIEPKIATEPGDDYEAGDEVFFLTDFGRAAIDAARAKVQP